MPHNIPTKKPFLVITRRDEDEFSEILNIPTEGYSLHSWNVVQVDVNHFQYVVVLKLDQV